MTETIEQAVADDELLISRSFNASPARKYID